MHSYFGLEVNRIARTGDIIADVSSTVRGTRRHDNGCEEREKELSSLEKERTQRMIKLIYRIACFRQDRL